VSFLRRGRCLANLFLALGLLLATACAAPSGPEAAASEWMQAVASHDGQRVSSLTCTVARASLPSPTGLYATIGVPEAMGLAGEQPKVGVADLRYAAERNDGTAAEVHITGRMHIQFADGAMDAYVNSMLPFRQEDARWRYCPRVAAPTHAIAAVSAVPLAQARPADLSGTYRSELGIVRLQQRGSAVTGSWTTPPDKPECGNCAGEISDGMLAPGRLAFKWRQTWNGVQGAASCGITADEIRCAHTSDSAPPGTWTLVRE
jgi:hypothetical protein